MSSRQTVLLKDKVLPSQGTKQTSYHTQSLLMHKKQGKTCFTQTPNFSGTSVLSQKLFLQSFLAKTLGHTKTWSSETSDFHSLKGSPLETVHALHCNILVFKRLAALKRYTPCIAIFWCLKSSPLETVHALHCNILVFKKLAA